MSQELDIETMRHSLSHVLAMAILEMFPEAKLGIGPAIENGFYYDFELPRTLIPEDLPILEEKMRKIINQDFVFEKSYKSKEQAIEAMEKMNQPYKVELAKEFADDELTFYKTDGFIDLCAGPHVESTKFLRSIGWKLDKIAGAYWRGDEKRPMMQRIYGLAFENKKELDDYIKMQEEAKRRDHKKLGRELGLFIFAELVGPGLPIYTPKGAQMLRIIKNYSAELRRSIGYQEVQTPNMNKAELFKVSGHYDKYKEDMFRVVSNYTTEEYYLKPMNCPQHTQVYASELRSYKDLPIRIADFAMLYRDEKPGELSGLTRLRGFSQDDGHCFCREDQIKNEFKALLGIVEKAMKRYGMNYYVRLSLRDEADKAKYLGDDSTWQKSQKILEDLLIESKIEYVKAPGEAAFYGPKMDLIAKDAIGREWQLSTIQLDFNMPGRFGLEYTDENGEKKTPVMIHAAIVGSPERFLGVLIEHYAGAFPAWLAPVQIKILPIAERHADYVQVLSEKLKVESIRFEVDERNESIGKKIREAELQKIPYMLIVGDKEVAAKKVAVRKYGQGDLGQMEIEAIIDELNQ